MIDKAAIDIDSSDEGLIFDKPISDDPCLQVSSTSASKRMRWPVRENILLLLRFRSTERYRGAKMMHQRPRESRHSFVILSNVRGDIVRSRLRRV